MYDRKTYISSCFKYNILGYICKDFCRQGVYCFIDKNEISGFKKAMVNIKPSLAYMIANRCGTCSESKQSIWYLKWVSTCPCCGSSLRRKSKHSIGRQKITIHMNKHRTTINKQKQLDLNNVLPIINRV